MEFIDPKLKQKHKKRLTIGYILLALLVVMATYILVATSMGYVIFQRDGQIIQNGIVFIDTKPSNAEIYLNGKKEDSKTDTRLTLPEGEYEVILKLQGYKDWTKRLNLVGGKVAFLNYPRFFPEKFVTEDLKAYEGKVSGLLTQSGDRRWVLFQSDITKPELNIIDTAQINQPQQMITLPLNILGSTNGKIGTLKAIEWSSDNKHLLIQHIPESGPSVFALIDREDTAKSVNLNTLFNVQPAKVSLFDKKIDKFYFYFASGGILKIGDYKSKTLSNQLYDQVLDFKQLNSDRLMFATTKNSTAGKVIINAVEGSNTFLIGDTEYNPSAQYVMEAAEFSGDWYYAIGNKQSEKIQVYKNPQNFKDSKNDSTPNIYTTLRPGIPQFVSFSSDKRFLLAQSEQAFSVYDIDTKTSYRVNLPSKLDPGTTMTWVDNFLVQYSINGKLYFSEFDGKNIREMATTKNPYLGFINGEITRLYTIESVGQVTISRMTKLTVEN